MVAFLGSPSIPRDVEDGEPVTALMRPPAMSAPAEYPIGGRNARTLACLEKEEPAGSTPPLAPCILGCREKPAVDDSSLLSEDGACAKAQPRLFTRRLCLSVAFLAAIAIPVAFFFPVATSATSHDFVLTGSLPRNVSSFNLHLGGFCFSSAPQKIDERVGAIELNFSTGFLGEFRPTSGRLHFLLFDDQEQHWGKAKLHWNTSSLDNHLHLASAHVQIPPTSLDAMSRGYKSVRVGLREHVPRHWQMMLVGTSFRADYAIQYQIRGIQAQSSWGPQELTPDSCPKSALRAMRNFLASNL